MAFSEILVLSDREMCPSDEQIFSIIGKKKIVWQSILQYMTENHKYASGMWRYYNDGKQWLFKMTQKKKTVFWIGVLDDTFRVTFYFGDKAEPVIESSELPKNIKEDFRTTKRSGKIRAVSIKISGESDLENIYKLIELKLKLK